MNEKPTAEDVIKQFDKEQEKDETKITLPIWLILVGSLMFISGLFGYSEGAHITDSEIGWLLAVLVILTLLNSLMLFIISNFVVYTYNRIKRMEE